MATQQDMQVTRTSVAPVGAASGAAPAPKSTLLRSVLAENVSPAERDGVRSGMSGARLASYEGARAAMETRHSRSDRHRQHGGWYQPGPGPYAPYPPYWGSPFPGYHPCTSWFEALVKKDFRDGYGRQWCKNGFGW